MSVGRLVDDAVNASIVLVGRLLVAVGYWRSERRRDAMAGRAQRFLHFRNDRSERPCADCGCLGFLIQRPVHPADAKHHGGHRLNLDGTVTPLTLSAQHLSAGGAVGPEAVSGQPPASGQPTATELLDHIDALVKAHYISGIGGYGVVCCCGHEGALSLDHAAHVADLVIALVAADVRVGDALKGTR